MAKDVTAKKLLKKLNRLADELKSVSHDEGWSEGWDEGWDQGALSGTNFDDDSENEGEAFMRGVMHERNRINSIMDMKIKDSLDMNRGSQAVFYRNTKELLNIQIDMDKAMEDYEKDEDW